MHIIDAPALITTTHASHQLTVELTDLQSPQGSVKGGSEFFIHDNIQVEFV